jgi:hypothetical protein
LRHAAYLARLLLVSPSDFADVGKDGWTGLFGMFVLAGGGLFAPGTFLSNFSAWVSFAQRNEGIWSPAVVDLKWKLGSQPQDVLAWLSAPPTELTAKRLNQ